MLVTTSGSRGKSTGEGKARSNMVTFSRGSDLKARRGVYLKISCSFGQAQKCLFHSFPPSSSSLFFLSPLSSTSFFYLLFLYPFPLTTSFTSSLPLLFLPPPSPVSNRQIGLKAARVKPGLELLVLLYVCIPSDESLVLTTTLNSLRAGINNQSPVRAG